MKIPARKAARLIRKIGRETRFGINQADREEGGQREKGREGKMNVNNPETRRTTDFINSSPEYRPVAVYLRAIPAKNENRLVNRAL